MKSDQYLNLCLEQAALSPLHYRHGCVVVKGGKVIGQGFNDCRPGYDGGSVLKTGVLPKSATSLDDNPDKLDPPRSKGDFKTVESIIGNCGGGGHANARLTMHSEMMAIKSALSSRSTLATNTVSRVKPCFKLPGDSKHKRALRRDAVVAYAEAVCLATFEQEFDQGAAHAQADEWRHYYQTPKQQCNGYKSNNNKKYNVKVDKKLQNATTVSSTTGKNVETHSASVPDAKEGNTGRFGLRKARGKQLVIPKGRMGSSSSTVQDRMKHPKLVGADVYVARLVNAIPPMESKKKRRARKKQNVESLKEGGIDACSTAFNLPPSTGSLHDELIRKEVQPQPPFTIHEDVQDHPAPAESRPCYRCVAYMHSVGIKRVFWTTNEGKWECAKVRDLIDQLDGTMQNETDTSLGLPVPEVFVTKHEVLLLRRLMSGQG
ncbi:hypothetical protein VMCG_06624 [Cytospora schulzeri]|uniref:CMP/dCMP-type deaminase domain-containing protein n=1 Tax=Cytospora schulzeri TaxID=448051 RepID=A0A423W6Z0_9PEZI|nr:hypothetical protein VMCG_06624 [Valsa malicola]